MTDYKVLPALPTATLLQTTDWTANGVGAIADWPASLRATVDLVLGAPLPMALVWGPEHVMIYNDGYAAQIAGARHPAAFAVAARLALPDQWEWKNTVFDACMRGETLRFHDHATTLQRHEGPEQAWFDLFYAPVRDDAGLVRGVLCTAINTTARVLGEQMHVRQQQALLRDNEILRSEREAIDSANRRLRNESDFLRGLFEQAPSFMAVMRGPEHIFQITNPPYMRLIGADRDVIGKPARLAVPEAEGQDFFERLDAVYRSGIPFVGKQVKIVLQTTARGPLEERIIDFVYQPIRDADGVISGIFLEGIDMTERATTEERLRIAQEAGGIGTFEWFPATGQLAVSDQYRRIWGFDAHHQIDAQLLMAHVDPRDRALVGVTRLGNYDNPLEYVEYRVIRADDGAVRWIARQGEVIDRPPAARRFVGIAFDITERKRVEESLRENEKVIVQNNDFIRLLLDSTEEGFYSIDRDGLTTLCNAAFLRMLGFEKMEDAVGHQLHEVIHHSRPDGSAYARDDCPIHRCARTGEAAIVDDERFFRLDGSSFPVEYRVHPVWRDGLLQGALCIFNDLTLSSLGRQALRASETRLTAIFGQASVGFGELDLTGRFTQVNEAMCAMFGRSREQFLSMDFVALGDRSEHDGSRDLIALTVASGTPFTIERRHTRPDGKQLWISCNVTRIVNEDGRAHALIAVATDISERRKAEEALLTLNETLEQRVALEVGERAKAEDALRQAQKMDAIGQLTGGVAHDFNNVLQIISSNLQLLQTQLGADPGVKKRLRTSVAAVERGAKLSSQLLAFARRQPLQPSVVNLARLLRGMDDLLRRAVGEAIAIEIDIGAGLWNTMVDVSQLENVILNLAINARDAMDGVGTLTISLANTRFRETGEDDDGPARPDDDYLLLTVIDNGCGMSPDTADKAFEPFFTTKADGSGTGLGLSMAYGFVKQSHGHIAIDSTLGVGTAVRVYLRRSLETESVPVEIAIGPLVGGSETILVVEDDPGVQASVVDLLSSLGYHVLQADNGDAALYLLESGIPVDLLFTDVVMPGTLRGPELAARAKQLLPGIAVLFTSGYTQNAMVDGGRLIAGVELLSKPYRMEHLGRKIRHMLANAQQTAGKTAAAVATGPVPVKEATMSGSHDILVVEDNLDAQYLVCEMLMALGHRARGAADAEEALTLLASQRFQVLFTDVNLPGMSGLELAKRAIRDYPEMKIIFASGYGADVVEHVDFTAASLPKPYDLMQLQAVLACL